jgi:intracellular multiplication protein IcmL
MLSDTLSVVKFRKNFYRDCYYRVLNFLLWSFFIILIELLLLILLVLTRPEPDYYSTSSNGKIILLRALDKPNYSRVPLIP